MTKHRSGPLLALGVALATFAGADEPVTVGKTFTLHSKVLNEDRTLLVHTPPACERAAVRCPVLYLSDAEAQFLHTVATAGFLARNNLMPPLVVVGITNTDRARDFTPTRAGAGVAGNRNPLPNSGGADNFLKFIETELVPHVEKSYGGQPYRIFCGHSLGGLFALHALFSRPDLFNALVAVSPTLMWDDDLPLRTAREFFAARSELQRTLFVTAGAEGPEMEQAFDELQRVLKGVTTRGFVSVTAFMPDEDHGSIVLRSHYAGLRKIFEGWRPPVDLLTGALDGGLETVRRHYAGLSERFGYPVEPPEGLVNNIGYTELARGERGRALQAFRLNVANYPDSANVHDSLGEAYLLAGDHARAAESYRRVLELDPHNENARKALAHLGGTTPHP